MILGAVTNGHVADELAVTTVAVQASLPLAVTVLLTEQASIGAVKLVVKSADAPGASVIGPVTGVPGRLVVHDHYIIQSDVARIPHRSRVSDLTADHGRRARTSQRDRDARRRWQRRR